MNSFGTGFRRTPLICRTANAIKMFHIDEIRSHEAASCTRSAAGQPKGGQAGAKRSFNFDRGRERSIKAGVSAVINPDCAAKCNPLARGSRSWPATESRFATRDFSYCNRRPCAESLQNHPAFILVQRRVDVK